PCLPRLFFLFNATAPPDIYTLSLHDALPISRVRPSGRGSAPDRPRTDRARCPGRPRRARRSGRRSGSARAPLRRGGEPGRARDRSEEHTSELQSRENLVCRLLLEKKKKTKKI